MDEANGHDLQLDDVWPRCAEHIAPALAHAGNTHTLEHVRQAIEENRAQLWPVGELGTVVTEIEQMPSGLRICRLWLAGGKMAALIEAEKVIAEWAKENGCDAVEITGRKGWRKVLPEYRHVADVLWRTLRTDG